MAKLSTTDIFGELKVSLNTKVKTISDWLCPTQINLAALDANGNFAEGRGLVVGYSGGDYPGIGYNIRHTSTAKNFIIPIADTASYMLATAQGFNFYSIPTGAAGRSITLSSNPVRIVNDVIYASSFRGKDNVGETGEAIHCPAGIYSQGTNYLYGPIITNNNSISAGTGAFSCGTISASGTVTAASFNSMTGFDSTTPAMNGTAAVGSATTVARRDHVHPTDTTRAAVSQTMYIGTTALAINRETGALALTGITSIDGSASKWTTAKTITLTGSVTGSVSLDGSGNVSLATTTNHTHLQSQVIEDTGAIMGVKFIDNGAGFNVERYGLAKGKTFSYSTNGNTTIINSDFDTMPIYKYMRRGIFDNNSVLVFDQDDVEYDDTLSTLTSKGQLAPHTHWVGVYIPKFYFKINVEFSPTYVMYIAVSDKAFYGSLVHPAFIQHDNSGFLVERDYVVFSAYEGVLVNKSTGAYLFTNRTDATTRVAADFQVGTPSGLTAYSTYAMTSVNKVNAQAPATNGTLSNFRTMAQNRSTGNSSGRAITQQQYFSWTAINTLFMVEFASTDWQSILSAGVTNLSTGGTCNESVSTGHTSALKGKSGYVTGIVRGALGTTQVPSYRGIENFFGNIWKFMEGFKKSSTVAQYGIYNITKTNDYSVYANLDFTNKKEVALMTDTNYYKYRNEELIPTNSTVSSTYVPDQYYYSAGGQTALSSASWAYGSISGGFAVALDTVFSIFNRLIGSRVFS